MEGTRRGNRGESQKVTKSNQRKGKGIIVSFGDRKPYLLGYGLWAVAVVVVRLSKMFWLS